MSEPESTPTRRAFFKAGGALTLLALPPVAVQAQTPPAAAPASASAAPATAAQGAYVFFNPAESETVEAIVARLIPSDALGPGAREAGAAFYVDHQLAGAWGHMARAYAQGPWVAGTPEQGWQFAMTPAEFFRAGLADFDAACKAQHGGRSFAALNAADQEAFLKALDEGKVPFDTVPSKAFFDALLASTIEGFFTDPIYGGNVGKVGWRLVGHPGASAAYIGVIEQHGQPYDVEPASLADLQSGAVDNDGSGHAVHKPRLKG